MTIFVWDEAKRAANLVGHKIDLADAGEFDWEGASVKLTRPGRRGDKRFKAIGLFRGRLTVVIFSPLGREAISVISMRVAGIKERRLYADEKGLQQS